MNGIVESLRSAARDPRFFQIAALSGLLLYGLIFLHFDVGPERAAAVIFVSLLTQYVGTKATGLARFDPKSALISALSLCLLLRTNILALHLLAAVIAIGSKFVIRYRGKHVFNPTNIAIVVLLLLTERVWVSPGQWGNRAYFAFLMACIGGVVVHRALRSDVTFVFLFTFVGLVIGRGIWLGDPVDIALHRLESGALLLYAFFMISDPKTTPDSRLGRVLFAAGTAWSGWYIQYRMFTPEGILYALAATSVFVPLIDKLLPGTKYEWPSGGEKPTPSQPEPLAENVGPLPLPAR